MGISMGSPGGAGACDIISQHADRRRRRREGDAVAGEGRPPAVLTAQPPEGLGAAGGGVVVAVAEGCAFVQQPIAAGTST
eukprot:4173114-Prymnesium_polylepis.1